MPYDLHLDFFLAIILVRMAGIEPAWALIFSGIALWHLKPLCLPFHHIRDVARPRLALPDGGGGFLRLQRLGVCFMAAALDLPPLLSFEAEGKG
jgi:hypothetical protein